jgi:hypothetical protein
MRERTEEFYRIYFPLYQSGLTQAQAYAKAEEVYSEKYKHNHYANFGSFSVSLYSRIKTEKKLKVLVKTL